MTRTDTPAGRRAKVREDFVWHLGTYLIMLAFFVAIAAMTSSGSTWVLWIAIPWGLAVAFHGLATLIDGTRVVRPEDEPTRPRQRDLV